MLVAKESRPLTGRRVLWGFVAAFGLVLVVNGVMAWFALASWPGLVSDTPYEEGLAYNRVLADGERQDAMGWQVSIAAIDGQLRAMFDDRDGVPIIGLEISAIMVRPTHEGDDIALTWTERKPGIYFADLTGVDPGNWDVVVETVRSGNSYRLQQRIYLSP